MKISRKISAKRQSVNSSKKTKIARGKSPIADKNEPQKYGWTPSALKKEAEAIFEAAKNRIVQVVTSKGELVDVKKPEPITLLALCLRLGWPSRRRFEELAKVEAFSEVCEWCKSNCERTLEAELLESGKPVGAMFALKNGYGWKDQQSVDLTTAGEKVAGGFVQYPKKTRAQEPT